MGRIRIGIMGTGEIARVMAMTLAKAKGVFTYAVASRTYSRAAVFAQEHRIKKIYGSYQELVNDPRVDLIYVATPHAMHFENARLALEARKAVLVEKAFTINEAQAQELVRLSRQQNVLLAEAIWTRYMPFRTRIGEVLSSGVIGYPTMLTANLGYPISQRERLRDPHLGGGALLDLGVYPLNFASMIFGDDVTEISSICTKGETGVDQQVSITLLYRNGRVAQLSCTSAAVTDRRGVIFGTKGYIAVDNINNPAYMEIYDVNHRRVQTIRRPRQISGYEYEIYACADAIRNGRIECPEMPHSETLKMLNMMDFIRGQLGVAYPGEEGYQESPQTPAGSSPVSPVPDLPTDEAAVIQSTPVEKNTDLPLLQQAAAAPGERSSDGEQNGTAADHT